MNERMAMMLLFCRGAVVARSCVPRCGTPLAPCGSRFPRTQTHATRLIECEAPGHQATEEREERRGEERREERGEREEGSAKNDPARRT